MNNVIPMKRRSRAERKRPHLHTLCYHPLAHSQDENSLLGEISHYDDCVVVHALLEERHWRKVRSESRLVRKTRKYVVDTAIEGVRLLLRVNGLHHATVQHTPDGFRVEVPPLRAGDGSSGQRCSDTYGDAHV